MNSILLVDDESSLRKLYENMLENAGYFVITAESGTEALKFVDENDFDVILTDISMPEFDGINLLEKIKKKSLNTQVIMITGYPTIKTAGEAIRAGAFDYITKPLTEDLIKNNIDKAVRVKKLYDEKDKLEQENSIYRLNLEKLIKEQTAELQITNKKLNEEMNSRKEAEKKALKISEQEQRRIGIDLHDGVGQDLTGLAFMAKVLAKKLLKKSVEEYSEANEIVNIANRVISNTQKIAKGLYPASLETDGLIKALEDFIKNINIKYNMICQLICSKKIIIKDDFVSINLYRIAQEATHNAIKHANPKNIIINIDYENNQLILTISDDGKGFSPKLTNKQGLGLFTMNHRASLIDAALEIKSNQHDGTSVKCLVKMENQNEY